MFIFYQEVAGKLGIPAAKQEEVAGVLLNLYELFLSKDASMVEINPFAEVMYYAVIKNISLKVKLKVEHTNSFSLTLNFT